VLGAAAAPLVRRSDKTELEASERRTAAIDHAAGTTLEPGTAYVGNVLDDLGGD
jgi:hypothetical protein